MTIRNPLYSYRFQKTSSVAGLGGGPLARYSETVRCPLGGDTDDATLSDAQLNDPRLALTSQTVRLLVPMIHIALLYTEEILVALYIRSGALAGVPFIA